MELRLKPCLFVLLTIAAIGQCKGYNLGQRGGVRRPIISSAPVEEQGITGEATFFHDPADTQLLVPLEPYPQEQSPPKNPVTPQTERPRPSERPTGEDAGNDQNSGTDDRGQSDEDRNVIYNYNIGYVGRPYFRPSFSSGSNSEYTWRGYAQEVRKIPVGQIRPGNLERAPLRPANSDYIPDRPSSFANTPSYHRNFDNTPSYHRNFYHYPTRRGVYDHDDPTSYRLTSEEDRFQIRYQNEGSPSFSGSRVRFENLRTDTRPYRRAVADADGNTGEDRPASWIPREEYSGRDTFPSSGHDLYDAQRSVQQYPRQSK